MTRQFSIRGDLSEDEARARLAAFFPPGFELHGYVVIGFEDGSPSPNVCSNGDFAKIIAGLSAALFGLTGHELTGEPAQPDDIMEIPYRAGAETRSLACPGCGSIGWARTPTGASCGGCDRPYSGQEIMALVEKATGEGA